jgi:outer membrane lipoprotein-sorting protein
LGIQGDVGKGDGCKAWIDPQSGLPLKIAIDVSSLAAGEKWNENASSLVFEDFKWNQELDKELFEPQLPEGFKVSDGRAGAGMENSPSKETASFPFSQVVERMKKVSSVQFTGEEISVANPGSPFKLKYSIQGNRVREEISYPDNAPEAPRTFVLIIDTNTKQVLHLTYPQKSASRYPLMNTTTSFLDNPCEAFASLKDDDAKLIGFEVLDEGITCVYELNKYPFRADGALKKGESTKIWVDPQTNLPVQLMVHMVSPEGHVTLARAKHFKWNVAIDPKLLEMTIPEGFTGSGASH